MRSVGVRCVTSDINKYYQVSVKLRFSNFLLLCRNLLLFLLPVCATIAGELKYQLVAEAGASGAAVSSNRSQLYLLAGLGGQLRYIHSTRNYNWYLEADAHPEAYIESSSLISTIFNFKGQYLRKHRKFHWSLSSSYWAHRINFDPIDFSSDILILSAWNAWFYHPRQSLGMSLEYAHREVDAGLKNTLSSVIISARWLRVVSISTKISAGVYAENFYIKNVASVPAQRGQNDGWRFGLEFSLDYKKKFVLNPTYRLFLHQSDRLPSTSFEHWIRLVFGNLLSPKWSLFFLADFFIRDYSVPAGMNANLLYTALTNQNRFYVKLEREANHRLDSFLKIGYVNENLVYENAAFSGWQGTIGLEFKN
jgi:hypothetical protein